MQPKWHWGRGDGNGQDTGGGGGGREPVLSPLLPPSVSLPPVLFPPKSLASESLCFSEFLRDYYSFCLSLLLPTSLCPSASVCTPSLCLTPWPLSSLCLAHSLSICLAPLLSISVLLFPFSVCLSPSSPSVSLRLSDLKAATCCFIESVPCSSVASFFSCG